MKAFSHLLLPGCLSAALAIASTDAQAADYPTKPVQVLANSSAGSTPDVALRFVTERLGQSWGQQVLVVNKPGAGGSVAARAAADAPPDGYTLYQPVLSTFVALNPAAANVPLHVPKDFVPIGFVTENPMFVAVSPTLGVNNLKELIELARKKPGEISYATTGIGRLTHLTGELLQHQAGIKLLVVPYTGGPAHAVSDVSTGRVSMIIRRLFRHRGSCALGPSQADCDGRRKAAAAIPRRTDRVGDDTGFPGNRLGDPRCAARHSGGRRAQGE